MKFAIFVLAVLGVGLQSCHHEVISIPDANPIQFWVNGEQTFNQQEVCSIADICFCQGFQCDDEIRIQFSDTTTEKTYKLRLLDNTGAILFEEQFIRKDIFASEAALPAFNNSDFATGSLSPWVNSALAWTSGTTAFAWSAGPIAKAAAGGSSTSSSIMYQSKSGKWPPGTYTVRIIGGNFSNIGTSSAPYDQRVIVYASDTLETSGITPTVTGTATWPITGGTLTSRDITFTLDNPYNHLGFAFTKDGAAGNYRIDMRLHSIQIIAGPETKFSDSVFDLSFTPSEIGICNESIQLEIIDLSDGSLKAYSDCVEIKSNIDCTTLINYSNSNQFAGLDYSDESPAISFNLRIPAIFFHESFPDESESLDFSDNTSLQLWAEVKAKKRLDIGYMPYYMYRKLQLVLAHDSVYIDSKYWIKQDALTITEGNKRYPLKMGNVLLLERDFLERNVL